MGYLQKLLINYFVGQPTVSMKFLKNLKNLIQGNTQQLTDGYHTFDELYQHRYLLYLALTKALSNDYPVWLAFRHHDGSWFEGYFLVCAELAGEQISYHLPNSVLNMCNHLPQFDIAPVEFDGHTSQDVLDRLAKYIKS